MATAPVKPRLRFVNPEWCGPLWVCDGAGVQGIGKTPLSAYQHWHHWADATVFWIDRLAESAKSHTSLLEQLSMCA